MILKNLLAINNSFFIDKLNRIKYLLKTMTARYVDYFEGYGITHNGKS